jgi:proteasome lid subunit RPN8/RPN11
MELATEVLEQAFGHLRKCGAGSRECVVYVTGPADGAGIADGVVHPRHSATAAGYDLDSESVAGLWRELLADGRSIRMQIHTHPGSAYHSTRDDALAIVGTPGFLSLVIPSFGAGPVGFEGAFLAERGEDGSWRAVEIETRLTVSR